MKRYISLLIFTLIMTSGLSADPSYSLNLGGDFFNYKNTFLDIGASCVIPIANNMELNFGANFGIATETEGSETEANFYIPLDFGLNFIFNDQSKLNFLAGAGVTPQLLILDDTKFYMGPYFKGGVRYQVHEYMRLFLEVQQDLLIGAPQWINTATRVRTGILFSFASK